MNEEEPICPYCGRRICECLPDEDDDEDCDAIETR